MIKIVLFFILLAVPLWSPAETTLVWGTVPEPVWGKNVSRFANLGQTSRYSGTFRVNISSNQVVLLTINIEPVDPTKTLYVWRDTAGRYIGKFLDEHSAEELTTSPTDPPTCSVVYNNDGDHIPVRCGTEQTDIYYLELSEQMLALLVKQY